jgi:V/A-type H+-transporting ATPase subunit I
MKKLSVVGHKKDRRRILRELTELGVVEVSIASEFNGTFVDKHLVTCETLAKKIARLDFAFSFLQECHRELKKKEFFNSIKDNQSCLNAKFGKENVVMRYEELSSIVKDEYELFTEVDSLFDINSELSDIRTKKTRISSQLSQLDIYAELDINFSQIKDTKHTSVFLGFTDIDNVSDALSLLPQDAIVRKKTALNGCLLAIIVFKSDAESVSRTLSSINFRRCPFNEALTPLEMIENLKSQLEILNKRRKELYLTVAQRFSHLKELKLLYDFYLIELQKAETMAKCRETIGSFIIEAWIPEESELIVLSKIESTAAGVICKTRDPEPHETPPSFVRNNKIVGAFGDNITATFGTPEYGGIDPNPFVMFFYCLFFGFMFSDAGYGLIMTVACALIILIKKPAKRSGGFFVMFMFCGLSTVVWGTLFGGWFGLTSDQLSGNALGRFLLSMQVLNSMDGTDILIMFGIALGLGVVQLAAGFLLNGVELIKKKKAASAILDNFSWVIILTGGGVAVFGILLTISPLSLAGGALAGLGLIMLLLGGAVGKKNPISIFAGAFKNLYGSINVFSDILSYSRLFSLCLTTGIIGMVINIIAGIMPTLLSYAGYVVAFVIYAGGHLFNFAINALGVYVHNSRLQYVEFFGKFFTGEGHPFNPLGSKTKYVFLTDGSVYEQQEKQKISNP